MFKKIFNYYCSAPLFLKMTVAFGLGIIGGIMPLRRFVTEVIMISRSKFLVIDRFSI